MANTDNNFHPITTEDLSIGNWDYFKEQDNQITKQMEFTQDELSRDITPQMVKNKA